MRASIQDAVSGLVLTTSLGRVFDIAKTYQKPKQNHRKSINNAKKHMFSLTFLTFLTMKSPKAYVFIEFFDFFDFSGSGRLLRGNGSARLELDHDPHIQPGIPKPKENLSKT